jgi:hypothetical protein
MKQISVLQNIQQAVRVDSIGENKVGNIIIRRGFSHRMGMDSEKFKKSVALQLKKAGLNYSILDSGEKYMLPRADEAVASGSYWWVDISPIENSIKEESK